MNLKSVQSGNDTDLADATDATGATTLIDKDKPGNTSSSPEMFSVLPEGKDLLMLAVDPTSEAFANQGIETEIPPGIEECPCFRCYLGFWYDGNHKRKPGLYHHTAKYEGKNKDQAKVESVWVCSPLLIEAQTHDTSGGSFGRLLVFLNSVGYWRYWGMPMSMLRGSGEELRGELFSQGFLMNPAESKLLISYLTQHIPKKIILAALQLGWHKDTFVLPDEAIGSTEIFYQSETTASAAFVQQGSLDEWRNHIASLAIGNEALVLTISAAFAGPLMKLVNVDSCGLHLYGRSSGGKTTALQASASVYGPPQMMRTWRGTSNGIEAAAADSNDTILILDEISQANPREIGNIVYGLGNGRGKSRANRTGGARAIASWRTVVLSSGELTLERVMQDAGLPHRAGQDVRLLNLQIDERTYGTFDELHGRESARAFADEIKVATSRYYGTAGRIFIKYLVEHLNEDYEAMHQAILDRMPATRGQEARAARQFALIGLAGELASKIGITGWPAGMATQIAIAAFSKWQSSRGSVDAETTKILESVRDYLLRYQDSRFSTRPGTSGYTLEPEKMIHTRAGYTETTEDNRTIFLMFPDALREATRGYDLSTVLTELERNEWLIKSKSGKKRRQIKVDGNNTPVYQVMLPGHPDEEDSYA